MARLPESTSTPARSWSGADTTSPYQAPWSNVVAGSYSLTAVARDNAGGTRTSSCCGSHDHGGCTDADEGRLHCLRRSCDQRDLVYRRDLSRRGSGHGEPGRHTRPRQADSGRRRHHGRHLHARQSAAGRDLQGRRARVGSRRHDRQHAVGDVHEVGFTAQGSGRTFDLLLEVLLEP